jgi:hypothetical protein
MFQRTGGNVLAYTCPQDIANDNPPRFCGRTEYSAGIFGTRFIEPRDIVLCYHSTSPNIS